MAIDPQKLTRFLCVCQKGETRSIATKRRLVRRGYGRVIATGCENVDADTFAVLCDWAEVILLADANMTVHVAPEFQSKIEPRFQIGRDRWGQYRHPELERIVRDQLNLIKVR